LGKISADGSKLVFGSFIADALPRTHNLHSTRTATSSSAPGTKVWPVTSGAFQTKFGGGPKTSHREVLAAGKLLAATYLGVTATNQRP